MKFEQPKELNRFVDDSMPMTWSYRWRTLRRVAPILVYCSVLALEAVTMTVFTAWLDGIPSNALLLRLLVAAVAPPLLMLLGLEANLRIFHRSKRVLELDEKGIAMHHTRHWWIPWARVMAFQIEPIVGQPGLAKINVVVASNNKRKIPRTWSVVLERTTGYPQLLSELRTRHQLHDSFAVHELRQPLPSRKPRPFPTVWPYLLGLFLLIHGLPLIGIGWSSNTASPKSDRQRKEPPAQFRHFVLQHFKSDAELRKFFLISGGVLTGLGLVCCGWGWTILYRHGRQGDEDRMREIATETERPSSVILKSVRL